MIRRKHNFLASIIAVAIVCSLVLTASVLTASATTFIRMDLATLARSAELIVRVRCTGSQTRWESGAIWTFDDFDVLETFKGAPVRNLRVRLPGGRVEHMETKIEGVPRFAAGEEAVIFLEKTSAGDYGVTSWAQGTFRVHRSGSGEVALTQDTSSISVFDAQTHRFAPAGIRDLPMSQFCRQLAGALSASSEK